MVFHDLLLMLADTTTIVSTHQLVSVGLSCKILYTYRHMPFCLLFNTAINAMIKHRKSFPAILCIESFSIVYVQYAVLELGSVQGESE